jgi:hypothetical protein
MAFLSDLTSRLVKYAPTVLKYLPGGSRILARDIPNDHVTTRPTLESDAVTPAAATVKEIITTNSFGGPAAEGIVQRNFNVQTNGGVALLNRFWFIWRGIGAEDHQLQQLMLQPGGTEDAPAPGKMLIAYMKNFSVGDDAEDYDYSIRHLVVADNRVRAVEFGTDLCTGSCTRTLFAPDQESVFVLRGFQLAYSGSAHNVDAISILESGGAVTVRLNDRNNDDNFLWSLKYALVPRDLFAETGSTYRDCTTDEPRQCARGGAKVRLPGGASGDLVIRGFHFNFRPVLTSGGDHHIRSIGVYPQNGDLEVYYEDKNGDDGFEWFVKWGILR